LLEDLRRKFEESQREQQLKEALRQQLQQLEKENDELTRGLNEALEDVRKGL